MSLLKTYTDKEKLLLSEHKLTNDRHSQISDAFVLGYRCNEYLSEHLRLKEEECKQLQQDKAELVEAFTSIGDYLKRFCKNALNQKLIIKSIAEMLEKHKCD